MSALVNPYLGVVNHILAILSTAAAAPFGSIGDALGDGVAGITASLTATGSLG
ncbi:hypothetical protein JO861_06710 [Rhodococcus hoagii]|uniref:hypothetical protein n=1 Tax=Rhodococcus hoagii TaxID=43767 RepID=UPI0019643D69|nr:hypothetical protein [Prescottella equi]MBM9836238.1 hypothetical protein [Prescottella equi]